MTDNMLKELLKHSRFHYIIKRLLKDDFDMAKWELEILEDIDKYVIQGEDSERKTTQEDIDQYNGTFVRLMKTTFDDFKFITNKYFDGLMFQLYSFKDDIVYSDVLNQDAETLKRWYKELPKESSFLCSETYLIIIKPDKIEHWIRTEAIREVDRFIKVVVDGSKAK